MEDLTVVYFSMDKEAAGKERRRDKWRYAAQTQILTEHPITVRLMKVRLPGYRYRKKSWTSDTWQEYWAGLPVPRCGREVLYLTDSQAKEILDWESEPLSLEWLLFLLKYYRITFDALVILQDRELEAFELVQRYAPRTPYLGVVTGRRESWEEMEEYLTQEYGFLLDMGGSLKELRLPRSAKTLFIAGKETYEATPGLLPENSIWLSSDSSGEAGKQICARAKGVEYIHLKRFLRDTVRK